MGAPGFGAASTSLERWWHATWSDLRLPEPEPDVLHEVLRRYAEPHRAYHTAQHLEECREFFQRARAGAEDPGAVQIALWFHDAIYDTHRSDNEGRSADWAVRVLAGAGALSGLQDSVRGLIHATTHNTAPASRDAALTADIDLSVLGAVPTRFDEYERQVRHEYAWVPEFAFRRARARILRELQARARIYFTDYFHELLEEPARANLERSIARLGG